MSMRQFTHGHALLIGVGQDLPVTVDDATGIANILRDSTRCAYPNNQVTLLTEAAATRQGVLDALDRLAAATTPESTVVFYFSGHGYVVDSGFGQQYFLMPHGYTQDLVETAISGREFMLKLGAIPAQKMLVLLDCCHAGGMDNEKAPAGVRLTKAPLPAKAAELLAQGRGRVIIASSQADEKSLTGIPYSEFTNALVAAFAGAGVSEKDGYVRAADLALYAREVVPQFTNQRQHPVLHFEQADNFVVAYYAGGEKEPKGLPPSMVRKATAERPETTATYAATNSGSGAIAQGPGSVAAGERGVAVGGSLSGSTIVTGDGNRVDNSSSGIDPAQLEPLFASLLTAAATAPSNPFTAIQTVTELKDEAAKGKKADDKKMAKLIEGFVALVPAGVGAVVSAFASPILGGVAGPVTEFVLEKIQGK